MEERTEELLENDKRLEKLVEDVWKDDFSTCSELKQVVDNVSSTRFMEYLKNLVQTAFKVGYNHGYEDGIKPQKDANHEEQMRLLDKQMELLNRFYRYEQFKMKL